MARMDCVSDAGPQGAGAGAGVVSLGRDVFPPRSKAQELERQETQGVDLNGVAPWLGSVN